MLLEEVLITQDSFLVISDCIRKYSIVDREE